MLRLVRLIAIALTGALVISGGAMTLVVVGHGLWTHGASAQEIPLAPLSATAKGGSTVYAADGTTVLAVLHASEDRKPIPLSQVSSLLIQAVLDTEDEHFYLHGGWDLPSTLRALASDSSSGGGLQGGSTITQQLIKQLYLTSQRKISRKIKEAVLAERLQKQYTKDQILQAYLNTIYLGSGAYGVEAAANEYFNTTAAHVTLPEAALIAGLIQNPNGYDPTLQPAAARDRRAQVLTRMVHYHHVTQPQADAANAVALPTTIVAPPASTDQVVNNYVQEVQTELLGSNSPLGGTYSQRYQSLFEGGLKIYTNLDPGLETLAEQKVAADTPSDSRGFQQAMVVVDPGTGKVKAMVGGSSQFNIVTQGARQPGSGFKLFTLLAALQQNYSIYDTLDGSSPCAIDFPTDHDLVNIAPAYNDETHGGGVMTLLNATAQSTNCAYIRLAHEVGLPNVVSMAHQLGIREQLPLFPSIVIGSIAVKPVEMAGAYATVADDGIYHTPTFIDHVVDRSGTVIYRGQDPGHRVISSQVAREATVALQAVVQYGTGTGAALYNRPVAGKTGTTNKSVDAWFNGFTPQMETTVWMGSPNAEVPMYNVGYVYEVFGGTYPAHTWQDFMSAALANTPVNGFTPPDNSQLPPSKYITSPSLVADDHTSHNYVYTPPSTTNPPNTSSPSTTPTTTPTTPTPPSTPPVTTPAVTTPVTRVTPPVSTPRKTHP